VFGDRRAAGTLHPVSVLSGARRTARRVSRNAVLEALIRAGLVGYGVLHLAVAWVAVRIALHDSPADGDQSGAFRLLAGQPFGFLLVWAIVIGLVAMALWQLLEAMIGHLDDTGARRVGERVVSFFRAVIYVALAWTAFRVVNGHPMAAAAQQREATAGLLGQSGGTLLVGFLGVFVTGCGIGMAIYGVTRGFARRLRLATMGTHVRRAVVGLGLFGYAAKGVAYAIVGFFLLLAAAADDARKSTGLDGVLRTLANQRLGQALLWTVAAGLAAFGVYCFFQYRYRKV
jgi:hypothetical protein